MNFGAPFSHTKPSIYGCVRFIYIYTLGGLAKFPNGDLELDFKQQKPEIKKQLAKWIITSEQNSLVLQFLATRNGDSAKYMGNGAI